MDYKFSLPQHQDNTNTRAKPIFNAKILFSYSYFSLVIHFLVFVYLSIPYIFNPYSSFIRKTLLIPELKYSQRMNNN